MKTLAKLVLISLMFLNWGHKGYCQTEETTIDFIEIYSDTQKRVSILPTYLGDVEGRILFSFKTNYLTPKRREAIKNSLRLASTPYIESTLVIYDSTWTQYKVLSITFYTEDGDVIDKLDMYGYAKWEDVNIDSKEEIVRRQYAHKFANAIGRE